MAVITNKPDMNFGIWAENGDIETPSSEKVSSGWDVEKPFKEQMNWVQNRQDMMLQYINQRGVPEWDSRTDYPKDAYTARSGVVYKALSPNTDKDPSSNTSIWTVAFATQQSFTTLNTEVGKIKNQSGYLSHYVQVNNPIMSETCRGVGYSGNTLSKGMFFDLSGNPELRGGGSYSFNGTYDKPNDVLRRSDLDAIIKDALRYKVGDLYLTTTNLDPSVILGYGTWSRFAQGRALVGVSENLSSPDWTRINGNNFGSYTHTLTIDEMPRHNHTLSDAAGTSGGGVSADLNSNQGGQTTSAIGYAGSNQPHNIVQPSSVVSIWQRTS